VDQEQKPPERSFIRELVPDWRRTREQKLWAVRIVLVLVAVLGILTLIGLPFHITLWDWLQVLAVPITVGAAVPLLNWLQKNRELDIGQLQKERELEVEKQRAQDEALQAYLDQLTQLLVTQHDQHLVKLQVDEEVRRVIKARTESLLRSVNAHRKWSIVLFLAVMELLETEDPIVSLAGADLREVNGYGAPLEGIDLKEANLEGANLRGANLEGANLTGANLTGADLEGANFQGAELAKANLQRANLVGTNLQETNLPRAEFQWADFSGAQLQRAHLREANLDHARFLQRQS
jgi:hypothetical protein